MHPEGGGRAYLGWGDRIRGAAKGILKIKRYYFMLSKIFNYEPNKRELKS